MNIEILKHELVNIIAAIFQNDGFDVDMIEYLDFFDDLGMDSVIFISMVVEIESYFNIEIPDEFLILDKFKNFTQIMSIIEELLLKKVEEV